MAGVGATFPAQGNPAASSFFVARHRTLQLLSTDMLHFVMNSIPATASAVWQVTAAVGIWNNELCVCPRPLHLGALSAKISQQ